MSSHTERFLKMVSIAFLVGARHLWEVVENKPASSLVVSLGKALNGTPRPTFVWKTGDPEIATPKQVQTYRPKHSDTSLSREWRINMANKKKISLFLHVAKREKSSKQAQDSCTFSCNIYIWSRLLPAASKITNKYVQKYMQ